MIAFFGVFDRNISFRLNFGSTPPKAEAEAEAELGNVNLLNVKP
jgi:hypothetical protein